MEQRIDSKQGSDPVFVTDRHGKTGLEAVEVRIGERHPGETRFAHLTPWQARRLAVALIWAASGEEPDINPESGHIEMSFPLKTKSK